MLPLKQILLLICMMFVRAYAQEPPEQRYPSHNAIHKGTTAFNVYYGLGIANEFTFSNSGSRSYCLGPVGIMYERLATRMIGLGADLNYADVSRYASVPSPLVNRIYHERRRSTTLEVMMRLNLHFVHYGPLDIYGLLGCGLRVETDFFSTDNPAIRSSTSFSVPGIIKPGIGCRYFFNGSLGIHLEIASGTPIIAGGITLAFP